MLPHAKQIQETQESIPSPQTGIAKAGRITGQLAPELAMMAPFMKGASAIPKIPQAIKTALGIGAYEGVKAKAQNRPVLPAAATGASAGLLLSGAGKLGATAIPKKIPGAERLGTALGMGTAGA